MAYRRAADRAIDRAHNRIAGCEMTLTHSFTEDAIAKALADLAEAQRYLARAIAARDAWDSVEHDDYEQYPTIAEFDASPVKNDA